MLNFFKKNIGVLFAFFSTLIILLLVFNEIGLFKGTILISDLSAEYHPLLIQVRRILTGQMGLLNFNTTLGDSFIGTFYYYMSSPFNILTLFIKDINLLVIIIVLLKLSLASAFCYLFLRYQFKEEKIFFLVLFAVLYSLSSFSVSYYIHIMWLDIYMLFPLLLLGIDKILKEKKHLLYIISLILIIFCNYYFAYMICIFAFIYYNFKLLCKKNNIKSIIKNNMHFILVSILACVGASFVLIPVASELSTYSRQNSMIFGGEKLKFSLNIVNIIKTIIIGNVDGIELLNDTQYYLFTSVIVAPLVYLYFASNKIGKREKIMSGIILLILVLSISCNFLNYAWHGFVPPSFFNGRYTFMFILFLLLISCKAIYNLEGISKYHYIIISILIFQPIILLVSIKQIKLNIFDYTKLLILITSILLLYILNKNKNAIKILLCILLFELNLNVFSYLDRYNFKGTSGNLSYKENIDYIKENEKDIFYRIEDNYGDTDNYSILYNYNSMDYFMSTVKVDLIDFLIKLNTGNHSYTKNTVSYDGNYTLLSSLLNIKYFIDFNNIDNCDYEKINNINGNNIYKNQYSLNLGYMVNTDILKTKLDSNGLENINKIYKDMTKIKILNKANLKKQDDYNYTFKNDNKNDFYLIVNLTDWYSYSDLKIYINDEELLSSDSSFLYKINNKYKHNKDINLRISANDSTIEDIEGIYVYYVDKDKFEESINTLKTSQLNITNIKRSTIKGTIDVKEDNKVLFTSIPYNKEIDIYVDGKKVKKEKVLNTFVGIKLDKGKHTIKIKYTPKTLYLSFIPSIGSLILLFGYLKLYKKKLAKN